MFWCGVLWGFLMPRPDWAVASHQTDHPLLHHLRDREGRPQESAPATALRRLGPLTRSDGGFHLPNRRGLVPSDRAWLRPTDDECYRENRTSSLCTHYGVAARQY